MDLLRWLDFLRKMDKSLETFNWFPSSYKSRNSLKVTILVSDSPKSIKVINIRIFLHLLKKTE
jgi:hypothetical protein